ncbi:BCSC C-terminal domain-containing protein [Photobacterium sp. BZF1]|uniref:cellulose biosynthesis protein BcsC n=1 Tax=Photobacterium sp. BZF1 TaxID=1904457 RepID=UPI0016538346|nr:cellulose biosynthesis protein BcsC [Photobacterium sp. BZF1]MBC7006254.1 BCSC C-terminal domain-containing protein [Photobacterium sp. BZF1]
MKNNLIKALACIFLLSQSLHGVTSAQEITPALQTLLDQAVYWHKHNNDERAVESLNKVLMVDTNNAQAMYYMALWAEQRGDTSKAKQWREQLAKAHPGAPQLRELQNFTDIMQLPQREVEMARRQANAGNIDGSLATWDQIFGGSEPPISVAPEYYQTMAGDETRYPIALSKLAVLSKAHPDNLSINLAYAKLLTYRESTRRQGIELLQGMAKKDPEANASLRQALIWLDPKASDEKYYLSWLQRHDDEEIAALFNQRVDGMSKQSGFESLAKGNTATAKQSFNRVLKTSPDDADALAGLGYANMKQGHFTSAANYLEQAANKSGKDASELRQRAQEARFYATLNQAKEEQAKGNLDQALKVSAPLARQSGHRGRAAKIYRASLLRQRGRYKEAEEQLYAVLKQDPKNIDANEQLYFVLVEQQKSEEAAKILSSLPRSIQQKVKSADIYGNTRNLVDQAINAGNLETAIAIIENGVDLLPNNPWLRFELAKLLEQSGRSSQADEAIAHLYRADATPDELYAAAVYADDKDDWVRAREHLGRVPAVNRTPEMSELYQEALANLKLNSAANHLASGNKIRTLEILKQLSPKELGKPYIVGRAANMMAQSGDVSSALKLIQQDIASGITGNASDYIDHISVLYKAGLEREALKLLNNPKVEANSTPTQMAEARNVYIINEADKLRIEGNYAGAYNHLTTALQRDPNNVGLMLAMARLYQSGHMTKQASAVYQYLLESNLDTQKQDARVGAINAALAEGNGQKAALLATELKDTQSAERLLLIARIHEANGEQQKAIAALRQARGKLLGQEFSYSISGKTLGDQVMADNPFITTAHTKQASITLLPWLSQETNDTQSATHFGNNDQETLKQVDDLMVDLKKTTSSWLQGGLVIRGRNGEDGLSKLTEARLPIEWSSAALGETRIKAIITPVTLDAGSSSGDANRRFGTGATIQGQVSESLGLSIHDGETLASVSSQGSQHETGVGIAMSAEGNRYTIDIGTTPIGFEESTVVGGAQWRQPINSNLAFNISGERRLVKDSLLSYAGAVDKFSGKFWGQVTKNGIDAQLSYDDGYAGYYAGTQWWLYTGNSVDDNYSIGIDTGLYMRPYSQEDAELKIGVHIAYLDFDKNLSKFSFGHGGYFSPQNYVSIAFPFNFSQKLNRMHYSLGGSLGYQSYNLNSAAYYPNDPILQSQLENYWRQGYAQEAYYDSESEDGIGYQFHAGLEYEIQPSFLLEAGVHYDTFGQYNETIGFLRGRRLF